MNELGKGDNATTLTLTLYTDAAKTTVKDISTSTSVACIIKDPLENVTSKAASLTTDGTDGKVDLTLLAAELANEGLYEVQVKVTGTPWSGQSSSYEFVVRDTLIVT